jgi:SAM-dependent methyltransferase
MPGRAVYDLLYRIGAARWKRGWDSDAGPELVGLVEDGTLTPERLGGDRAIDLGCGSGANVLYLAGHGFDAVGVDFSAVAVRQARERASAMGLSRAAFLEGDVTRPLDGIEGPFDLIVLYNVLQDLDADRRAGAVDLARTLARAGSRVLVWCWYAPKASLPLVSYKGPSKLAPFVIEPGEERALFDGFEVERPEPQPGPRTAVFLLARV